MAPTSSISEGKARAPGSDPITQEEELGRVGPVLERLAGKIDAAISVDTFEPKVAEACLELGLPRSTT